MESADARAADSREIVTNQSKVRELRDRLELVEAENRQNLEALGVASKD